MSGRPCVVGKCWPRETRGAPAPVLSCADCPQPPGLARPYGPQPISSTIYVAKPAPISAQINDVPRRAAPPPPHLAIGQQNPGGTLSGFGRKIHAPWKIRGQF